MPAFGGGGCYSDHPGHLCSRSTDYAAVDFSGFANVVQALGGLRIYLDAPARDEMSGLDLPQAGCVELDGSQALAYVRSRYLESFETGRWTSDPTSDLGRIQRQ